MNCSKCNKELKDGAKFCTSCGTPVADVQQKPTTTPKNNSCPKCSAPLKTGAKFCTSCGTPITQVANVENNDTESQSPQKSMNMVKQKIVWNVLQGEVARTLKESEFVEYDNATGIIVDDGTAAIIRSNGNKIAEIYGGAYDFVDTKELENILNSRTGGITSGIKKGFKAFMNMILGQSVKERIGAEEIDPRTLESLDAIVESMRANHLLALTLKLNRDFSLVIGSERGELDDYADFTPMKIKSKYLDLNIGVHALFRISDFDRFTQHYLADRSSVTTSFLANELTPIIRTAIEEALHNVELQEARLPDDVLHKVKSSINRAASEMLYGISIVNIIDVSVDEENLERFRTLSRELYLSEKELDFLKRTNDLKNRLNLHVDEQTLYDARREVDRDRALMEVNRDGLLNEDEMEKFKLQLKLEKAIREARSEEEYQTVLAEIEMNGLERVHSLNIKRLRADQEIDNIQLERNRTVRIGKAETDVMERRIAEDYEYEKKEREDKRNEQKAESAIERLRKIKEMEREDKAQDHQMTMDREREANQTRLRDIELKANMSPQQLMAMASENNMDSAAAQKLAESFSAGMDIQQQKEFMSSFNAMNQSRIDDQMANADRMERMMNRMMDMTTSMAGGIGREQESLKNEYRDRLQHQEGRMDSTMDRSLDYATKNNALNQSAPQAPTTYMVDIEGVENQQHTLPQITLLIKKGKIGADTLIYSSVSQDWIEAYRYNELSNLLSAATPKSAPAGKSCPSCNTMNGASDMFCDSCGAKL